MGLETLTEEMKPDQCFASFYFDWIYRFGRLLLSQRHTLPQPKVNKVSESTKVTRQTKIDIPRPPHSEFFGDFLVG